MHLLQGLLLFGVVGLIGQGASAHQQFNGAVADDEIPPPLPRWREGGTPHDPNQALEPYAIEFKRDIPTSGYLEAPPEYSPTRGVVFKYITGHWTSVVTDCVVALTSDPAHDDIAYVVVNNSSQQTVATNDFVAHGADMSKVRFLIQYSESVWLRDYGPHFTWQDGALTIVDSHYYPTRPNDNFIPTMLGDNHFIMPTYDMGLYYSGGNFLPGPERAAWLSSLVNIDNPASQGFTPELIAELYQRYQGIDTLHIMPKLPANVDGTGHIDMWMYIVDEDSVIISEFKEGSNQQAIDITNNAVPYMEALGFEVHRTPAWNVGYTHYTYTNAFRVGDRILAISYGEGNPSYLDEDAEALAAWEAAAGPNVEIIPINCYSIIPAAGAIHCIVMQVPLCTESIPTVHVVSPDGGELLVPGTTHTIQWAASDTDNVEIPQIDLYYSPDGGRAWNFIATTTDTGFYDWTVPDEDTTQAMVRVVATSSDTDQGEGVSADFFQIAPAQQTLYDFTTGGGVDKFGWGYQVYYWSLVDGNRTPVSNEISTLVADAYDRLSYSDATGSDYDPNRYISPTTSYRTTHTFEFTIDEDPAQIDDIAVLWEGYADQCTQIELYVWDYVEGQWGDGAGLYNQNRYMDNWAGNIDGYLEGHLQSDFDRYIDASGQMTFLLFGERTGDESYHDYMELVVTRIQGACPEDVNDDGWVDIDDLFDILAHWGEGAGTYDVNDDGMVDIDDVFA
ncbi:MAG: agmatine deiminase family protein, partial [Phycisphaerales bacterium]